MLVKQNFFNGVISFLIPVEAFFDEDVKVSRSFCHILFHNFAESVNHSELVGRSPMSEFARLFHDFQTVRRICLNAVTGSVHLCEIEITIGIFQF